MTDLPSRMGKDKVAFIGPISSYSHQAVIECFPETKYEYVPLITFRDIFEALQAGKISRGVVPFENSTNGSVISTLDLLADRSNLYLDVNVCGEVYLGVHHYLLGHVLEQLAPVDDPDVSGKSTHSLQVPIQSRARPLASLKHIDKIYSHPQAFGQCEIFLSSHMKGIERIDVSSTSKAAELVKADKSGTSAAIASNIAAEVHGLMALGKGIEDQGDNTTRFFILRTGTIASDDDWVSKPEREVAQRSKTLVSFTVDHKSPGALADVLDCLKRYKLNLTSINSRPSRNIPFQYIFFVEFEGSMLGDPGNTVSQAIDSLSQAASSWRWLGSWENKMCI